MNGINKMIITGSVIVAATIGGIMIGNALSAHPTQSNRVVVSTQDLNSAVSTWNSSVEPEIIAAGQVDPSVPSMAEVVSVGGSYWVTVLFADDHVVSFTNVREPAGSPAYFEVTDSTVNATNSLAPQGFGNGNVTMASNGQMTLSS